MTNRELKRRRARLRKTHTEKRKLPQWNII